MIDSTRKAVGRIAQRHPRSQEPHTIRRSLGWLIIQLSGASALSRGTLHSKLHVCTPGVNCQRAWCSAREVFPLQPKHLWGRFQAHSVVRRFGQGAIPCAP
jgi:hypothetical protein